MSIPFRTPFLYLNSETATPVEHIAIDEALMLHCEQTAVPILRTWHSEDLFVVLGRSGIPEEETHLDTCRIDGIPIIRRCSGGGTVLQGTGCLNYALILPIHLHPALHTISTTTTLLLGEIREALRPLLPDIRIKGYSDLTLNSLKFSGNAQKRSKTTLLFHGTFLLNFDLDQISRYLKHPKKQPDYRENRSHADFLTNLNLTPADITQKLQTHFNAHTPLSRFPESELTRLIASRYQHSTWQESP